MTVNEQMHKVFVLIFMQLYREVIKKSYSTFLYNFGKILKRI